MFSAAVYNAAPEEVKQQAGPCGKPTLQHYKQEASLAGSASLAAAGDLLQSFNVARAVVSTGCVHHRRVENSDCDDAHISDSLSIRPRSLIVNIGQLREGVCSAAEYTGADGGLKQQAAPCGTLTLKQFKQEASLAGAHRSRQRLTCFILAVLPAPSGRRAACTFAGSRLAMCSFRLVLVATVGQDWCGSNFPFRGELGPPAAGTLPLDFLKLHLYILIRSEKVLGWSGGRFGQAMGDSPSLAGPGRP